MERIAAAGSLARRTSCPYEVWAGVVLLMILLFTCLSPNVAQAQEENRAGLVIVHGDGSVVQQCVAFTEESISGYELLQRAGAALSVEAGGFGATVCSIDGEGCSYPAESCFCQCQSSPCIYWSYWRRQPDGPWRYQPLGAGNTQVRDGDVEGWHWAAGTRSSAVEPPAVRFEDICAPEAQAASATEDAVDAVDSAAVQASVETPTAAAAQPAPALTATAAGDTTAAEPGVDQAGVDLRSLWGVLAAVVILPAAVLLMWALMRRK